MKKVVITLVLVLAVVLGACGDDERLGSGEEDLPVLRLATPPGKEVLAFTSKEASAEAGEVAVEFHNPQPVRHKVVFEDSSGKIIGTTDRIFSTATYTVIEFEPGEYTFFCSLGAGRVAREGGETHREAGMEGTLTVE
jgi:plastocyanin